MLVSHPPQALRRMFPSLVWEIETKEPEIFLTFDDGPTPGVTDKVLDLLKRHGAKATFFCLGKNIVEHPVLFQRIIDEGHSVGNHTFEHSNGWKSKTIDFLEDVYRFNEIYQTKLFRPPYGRLKPTQISALKKKYKIIMWSTLSMDYDPMVRQEQALKVTLKNLKAGSIVVLHDSLKAQKTMLFVLEQTLNHINKARMRSSAIH